MEIVLKVTIIVTYILFLIDLYPHTFKSNVRQDLTWRNKMDVLIICMLYVERALVIIAGILVAAVCCAL